MKIEFEKNDHNDMGWVLANAILYGLKEFRASKRLGYPGHLASEVEWDRWLDTMIEKFEKAITTDTGTFLPNEHPLHELMKEYAEIAPHLWD